MVAAPIAPGKEAGLRAVLESMNAQPGIADPANPLLPFGALDRLHFARFVILEDATLGDIKVHGLPVPSYPKHLVFMGDCDGPAQEFLASVSSSAASGLRMIFSHCDDFNAQTNLRDWLVAHDMPVAVNYVNWRGRTVRQVTQESALQRVLSAKVARSAAATGPDVQHVRTNLIAFVDAEVRAGRLTLTPPDATPMGWKLANCAHAIAIPLAGLIALPLIIVLAPFVIIVLRQREK